MQGRPLYLSNDSATAQLDYHKADNLKVRYARKTQ